VPGLADAHVIKTLCALRPRPVNIMMGEGGPHVSSRNVGYEQDQLWAAAIEALHARIQQASFGRQHVDALEKVTSVKLV